MEKKRLSHKEKRVKRVLCSVCLKKRCSLDSRLCKQCKITFDAIDRQAEDLDEIRKEMIKCGIGVKSYGGSFHKGSGFGVVD